MLAVDEKFANLAMPQRIWVIPSIYGEARMLADLHDRLALVFRPGDRLVYTGNYLGFGPAVRETIDELLRFRRHIIAQRGVFASDVVYLRGQQEEIWQKLLLLQFAPQPANNLTWMLDNGAAATLQAYGGDCTRAVVATREGPVAMARWTNSLRQNIRDCPGHEKFLTVLRRAAFTHYRRHWPEAAELLFVHAGLNPEKPLAAQGDHLWWGHPGFDTMTEPYLLYGRVIRGVDPAHSGLKINPVTTSVDAGCGPIGGPLLAVCFAPDGQALSHLLVDAPPVEHRLFA